jgi:hypothetical protein
MGTGKKGALSYHHALTLSVFALIAGQRFSLTLILEKKSPRASEPGSHPGALDFEVRAAGLRHGQTIICKCGEFPPYDSGTSGG